jgi:hypothetical protein
MADEEPAAPPDGRNSDGVFHQIMPSAGLCRVEVFTPGFPWENEVPAFAHAA